MTTPPPLVKLPNIIVSEDAVKSLSSICFQLKWISQHYRKFSIAPINEIESLLRVSCALSSLPLEEKTGTDLDLYYLAEIVLDEERLNYATTEILNEIEIYKFLSLVEFEEFSIRKIRFYNLPEWNEVIVKSKPGPTGESYYHIPKNIREIDLETNRFGKRIRESYNKIERIEELLSPIKLKALKKHQWQQEMIRITLASERVSADMKRITAGEEASILDCSKFRDENKDLLEFLDRSSLQCYFKILELNSTSNIFLSEKGVVEVHQQNEKDPSGRLHCAVHVETYPEKNRIFSGSFISLTREYHENMRAHANRITHTMISSRMELEEKWEVLSSKFIKRSNTMEGIAYILLECFHPIKNYRIWRGLSGLGTDNRTLRIVIRSCILSVAALAGIIYLIHTITTEPGNPIVTISLMIILTSLFIFYFAYASWAYIKLVAIFDGVIRRVSDPYLRGMRTNLPNTGHENTLEKTLTSIARATKLLSSRE